MFQCFKNEKFQSYIGVPFLILAIVLFIHSRDFSLDFSISLDQYLYSSWLFNYEYGFMQRGLIGELLSKINYPRDYSHIRYIAISIYLLVYYTLYILIFNCLKKLNLNKNEIFLYVTCFFFCSFTLSQFTLELGRFDQLFQLLSLFFLVIVLNNKNIYISSIYILLVIPFITLTHEAGIIIFLPTILIIYYLEYSNIKPIIFFSLFAIISILLITHFGKINADHLQRLINNYISYKGYNEFAFRTTSLSLYENLLMNWHSLIEKRTLIPITLCLVIISPLIILIIKSINSKKYLLLFIFTATPLGLSLIAFDYFRWISLFTFNIFVLLIYLINKKLIDISLLKHNLKLYKKNIIIYSFISLFLGPLGVINIYPHIQKNNDGGLSSANLPLKTQQKLNFLQ